MKEFFNEIFSSIRDNKLRTILTGFSVAWGIFILIVLLGAGNGFQRGVESNLNSESINIVTIYPSTAQKPYRGLKSGRRVMVTDDKLKALQRRVANIIDYGVTDSYYGVITTSKGDRTSSMINGISPTAQLHSMEELVCGRFINHSDNQYIRKTVTVNEYVANLFYGSAESAINKTIFIDGIGFTVVGVVSESNFSGEYGKVSTSITTLYDINAKLAEDGFRVVTMTVEGINTIDASKQFDRMIKAELAELLNFDKMDSGAIWVSNNIEWYLEIQMVFRSINIFMWLIGLGVLLIGVVGISNIMIVSVNERIYEFGIRKSMGATPMSLVKIILAESVTLTSIFGYIGLFFGILSLEILNHYVENGLFTKGMPDHISTDMFVDPTIDISTAITATIILIIAGLLAGYIPARKAVKLKTIDAMRHNK